MLSGQIFRFDLCYDFDPLIAMITSKSQNGNYLKTRIKGSRMMEDHVGQWRNLRHYHARYHHSQPTSASPKVTTESVLRPIT